MYHYAANNPIKYIDPDGRITWNRAAEGDYHYNSLYDPNLRNSPAVFSTNIKHYRATRETGNINGHSYSLSGTKDVIEIRQGGVLAQTTTKVTLKRFNVKIDGKSYDVFKIKGGTNTRLFFVPNNKPIDSLLITNDFNNDAESIYNGFFNRNSIANYLGKNDALSLGLAALSFGLTAKMDPISANFTEGLLDYLSSMNEGKMPETIGIDKKTLDLINQIIAEHEED